MPAEQLTTYIKGLDDPDLVPWGAHEENTARLLETLAYQLEWGWADRTIDPEDDEVKRERARMRKQKPPRHPIVPPAAFRPAAHANRRVQEYVDALKASGLAQPQAKEEPPPDPFDLLAVWKSQRGIV